LAGVWSQAVVFVLVCLAGICFSRREVIFTFNLLSKFTATDLWLMNQEMFRILMMEAVSTSETSVDNYFTRQYIPEDNSEHHTRRRENLISHNTEEI
jgi:hypothetical protein